MRKWKSTDTVILAVVWAALVIAATVTIIFVGGIAPRLDGIRQSLSRDKPAEAEASAFDYIAFDPFVAEGQRPGSPVPKRQAEALIDGVRDYAGGIRVYGMADAGYAVEYAKRVGLGTIAGVWLSSDEAANSAEMRLAGELIGKGAADILCVGNEVLLTGGMTEEALLRYIEEARRLVRESGRDIPIAYADTPANFSDAILAAIDIALPNLHPYWAGIAPENGSEYVAGEVERLQERIDALGTGTRIIVGETGYPNTVPGWEDFWREYLAEPPAETVSFMLADCAWKAESGREIEAHWGLFSCAEDFALSPKPELREIIEEVRAK